MERKKKSGFSKEGLKLSFQPYDLRLKHTFTLSGTSRNTTPVMLVHIDYCGITGYGEASMPPYLGESHETAARFLRQINLEQFYDPFCLDDILSYVDAIAVGNCAAKASVDIALHDLVGKLIGKPWYQLWGLNPEKTPCSSYTIGIDRPEVIREKVRESRGFKILKVKLGRNNDREMIETIRSVSQKPLCVDVNQGWTDKKKALDMIFWFKEQGVQFVEQPMPKQRIDEMAWLTAHSPLPTMADEAVQRLEDVKRLEGVYSGINIKLMKCTGMREACKMAILARALQMKVMIGCMTETSCAVAAAANLAPLTDWADLDGNHMIVNDVFEGLAVNDGKIQLSGEAGLGIRPRENTAMRLLSDE